MLIKLCTSVGPLCGTSGRTLSSPFLQRDGYSSGCWRALLVLGLAAQTDHCWRGDEHKFRLGHQQRLAAEEREAVIQLRNFKIKTKTLALELLRRMDAYWDVANHLSVDQIFLYDKMVCRGLLGFGMPS